MGFPRIKARAELVPEFIRRVVAYTDQVTYFGANSVARAFAEAGGGVGQYAGLLFSGVLRRYTLQAASDEALDQVLVEAGTQRRGATRARMIVVVSPLTTTVTAITGSGPHDLIEVADSDGFLPADSIRIRNSDGTVSEIATIGTITTGTGPSGGDELQVLALGGSYTPATDDVRILMRAVVPLEAEILTSEGIRFQTLAVVTTGDANPVLAGESASLALADKVWCEATVAGSAGQVGPGTVTGLGSAVRGVVGVNNPEGARGGYDTETDFEAKRRTTGLASAGAQETLAWLEATARLGNDTVLRAFRAPDTVVGSMAAVVLSRSAAPLSVSALSALEAYIEARVRSYLTVNLENLSLTSVEVYAEVTLDPDVTLQAAFVSAADRLAGFLDLRKWQEGASVDESDLLVLVRQTPGIASLVTATFEPPADVAVEYLPVLARLHLVDTVSGAAINATLSQTY